ncbi:hypothetical protein C0J52_16215 [Blattella germanica]|nr:hypothetical protein C0J52_16215 [Blattella germanica]
MNSLDIYSKGIRYTFYEMASLDIVPSSTPSSFLINEIGRAPSHDKLQKTADTWKAVVLLTTLEQLLVPLIYSRRKKGTLFSVGLDRNECVVKATKQLKETEVSLTNGARKSTTAEVEPEVCMASPPPPCKSIIMFCSRRRCARIPLAMFICHFF